MFEITKIGNVLDRVKTPLTLGGLVILVLYGIYSQILTSSVFSAVAASAFTLLQAIVRYLFWLALVALILGVGSYLAVHFVTKLKPAGQSRRRLPTEPPAGVGRQVYACWSTRVS